jgi:hypothetical protein
MGPTTIAHARRFDNLQQSQLIRNPRGTVAPCETAEMSEQTTSTESYTFTP